MNKLRLFCIAMLAATGSFAQGWTQKSNFSGGPKSYAFSFVIGSKAYIGTGLNNGQVSNDVWEYDPTSDTWTQRAAFIGQARYNAVSFVIDSKGYVGTGANIYQIGIANFFEYDPATNSWRSRASLANGLQRTGAVGFSIGTKGYIGLGRNNSYFRNDLWEYDPTLNNWRQRTSYPGVPCADATAFTIGSKAYVGLGYNAATAFRSFYEYNPASNSWTTKPQLPSLIRSGASAMVIGNKAYIALGSSYTKDVLEYDPAVNQWKRKMDFKGLERKSAASFSINGKGYIVGGMLRNIYYNDVWEYTVDTCRISALAKPHVKPSLCVYDSITMSANADSGLSYQWRLNGIEIPGANNRYYYAKTPGFYSVVLTGNYVCSNVSSGINVIKPCNETPAIAEAGSDKRICIDDSASIKGSVSGSATKASWSGGNGVFIPNRDSLFITYIPTAEEFAAGRLKLYLVTNDPDSTGPVTAGIDSLNIYISTGPPPPTTINGPWNFCSNTSNYVYSVPAEKGVIYSWVVSDDAVINSGQGTGSINVSYTANAVSDTVFVSSTNGCGTSPEIFILVNRVTGLPAPTPPISGINSGCPGTSAKYSITRTTDAISYTWTPPKGATINGSPTPVTIADTAVTVVYSKYFNGDTLKVKAINCFGNFSEEIIVVPRKYVEPPAEIIGSTIGCANDSNIYKLKKVLNAEYYFWSLPVGATINGKALTYSSPDTAVTIVFSGAFSSDSIKVKAYGCAGFSANTALRINRATGTANCHGCTLTASINNTTTNCAGDSVMVSSTYNGSSNICNSCELYATGIYSSIGNVTNASASLSTPDGLAAWLTKGSSGNATRVIWDMGEVIPAGSTITIGVRTDGCSGESVKSMMKFWISPVGGPGQEAMISQSGTIAYYSSKYREFNFNTSVDGQLVGLTDEGGCGIRVDYIKWKKSCCTSSTAVTYLWSTGATTADINVTPGSTTNYSVKVTDLGGCKVTANTTVNVVDQPVAKINGNGFFCEGNSTQLCADSAASYLWSDGSTSQCITVNAPGNYILTVSNGVCSASETINVNAISLSDNNECTTDACDANSGQVTHTPINVDDNNLCTVDACNTFTGVISHTAINIDDNNSCTTDACSPSNGVSHVAISVDDNNLCTTDACDPVTGPSHSAINVDDNNECTTDGCNSVTGVYHNPVNTNDNNACTTDGCDPILGIYNNPINIDDNNACTNDACHSLSGVITHTAINVNDNNVCTIDACNPATGPSHINVILNDNNACTADACDPITGPSYTIINVNDNNDCTTDGCNIISGVYHNAKDADDDNGCTTDGCDPITGIYNTPIDPDDNNECTIDACDPVTGVSHVTVNTNDLNACTTDGCDPVTGVFNKPVNINDGNSCTIDACNSQTGAITHTAFSPPADPVISGNNEVCSGSQGRFKATGTPGVTNYTWTVPKGVTILMGQGTDSLVVKFGTTFISSSICAFGRNACGNSRTVCYPITLLKTVPSIAGTITGPQLGVCVGTTAQYCIAPQANAKSYLWTVPLNTQIISGAGTNCINVSFLTGFKSGKITVKAQNCVGNSVAKTLTVYSVPTTPGAISGPVSSLKSKTGVVYSVPVVGGATSYKWTVPTGAKIVSGQGTISITVDFTSTFTSGSLSVIAVNACGNSTARSVSIKGAAASSTSIIGSKTVCAYNQGITYEVASVAGVVYTWTVPSGVTIVSGQGKSSIIVNWGAASGSVSVARSTGTTATLAVTVTSCLKNTVYQPAFEDPALFVNPNPTKSDFSLVFKAEKEAEYLIIIRDMVGKVIYNNKVTSTEGMNIKSIKTDGFAKGIYILTLNGEKVNNSLRVAVD